MTISHHLPKYLTLDDKTDARELDAPLYHLDPASLLEADLYAEEGGALPDLSLFNGVRVWKRQVEGADATERLLRVLNADFVSWRWLGSSDELIVYIRALQHALKYPLCKAFRQALSDCLGVAREEAGRRARGMRARRRLGDRYQSWEDADLLAEIELVCGAGVRRGRNIWFSCCFHVDAHPSLSVDPLKRVWYCHPCSRGGGVVDFRKAIEVPA